jgi:hypothetical protein
MSTLKSVARRIESEVGLSRAVSIRIAKKLNELAKSVEWAIPVGDGRFFAMTASSRRGHRRTSKKLTASPR